jgi:hypothetical protein
MQEVVGVLDREMSQLSSQLYEFDQRNISGVEDLSRLDTLKLNMERCRDTLEEHARWNQLVREAKTMMESGGHYSDCADRYVAPLPPPSSERFTGSRPFRTLLRFCISCRATRSVSRPVSSSRAVSSL